MVFTRANTRSHTAELGDRAKATRAASTHAGKLRPLTRDHASSATVKSARCLLLRAYLCLLGSLANFRGNFWKPKTAGLANFRKNHRPPQGWALMISLFLCTSIVACDFTSVGPSRSDGTGRGPGALPAHGGVSVKTGVGATRSRSGHQPTQARATQATLR